MRCPECGGKIADPTRLCARCGAPAVAQLSLAAHPAVGQKAEDARLEPEDPYRRTALTIGSSWTTSLSVSQLPIRRGMAFTGAGIALLAGITGLTSELLFYAPHEPAVYFFGLASYLLPTAVAVAALLRINRLVIVGLLQGMWWPAVAYVTQDLTDSASGQTGGYTGRFLAAFHVGVISDVLGAGAAILLVVSWSRAVDWHRVSRLRPLPVMLLCGVCLSQGVVLIFTVTQNGPRAQSLAELLVGLSVTWYAANLRASALGGSLVLGWSIVVALGFLSAISPWTAIGVLGCVLLAAVAILAVIYMRGPAHPDPQRGAETADLAQPDARYGMPAAAPPVADLARGHQAEPGSSARDVLVTGQRMVDTPGVTHTFCYHRGRHRVLGILGAAFGAALLALLVGILATTPSQLSVWGQVLMTGGGFALVWLGIRQFRVGIQISGETLIIRNEWRTYTVNTCEVRAITLQPKRIGEGPDHWMPRVDLTSGNSVWITNLDCGRSDRPPRSEPAAILDEVRTLLGIASDDLARPETR